MSDEKVCEWLKGFADCVRNLDFEKARTFFYEDVYCFGSYLVSCDSLDALVENQWKKVWPNITAFAFELDRLQVKKSSDELLACAMIPWRSTGYDSDNNEFERAGRVTLLLMRRHSKEPWQAYHTHYSLNPGTSQTAVG